MKYKNIIIYGGTSEISIELIKLYANECEKLIIFCREKQAFTILIQNKNFHNLEKNKLEIYEVDLLDLNKNLDIIKNFKNNISGIIFVSGFTGDAKNEYLNINQAEKNIKINFLNPIIIITEISKKMIKNDNSFIAAFTSVAGLRGRKKQLYYSPAKSGFIAFLSALRQKLFFDKILVTTVIPGYMNTKSFRNGKWNAPSFLITDPKKVATILKKAIEKNKEIIYINTLWGFIMKIINLIPEKIFKRFSF